MGRGEKVTARQLPPIKNTPVGIKKQAMQLFQSGLVWAARFYPIAPKNSCLAPAREKKKAGSFPYGQLK